MAASPTIIYRLHDHVVLHRSGCCPPSTSRGLADRARTRGWPRVAEATAGLRPLQIPQEQCKARRAVPEVLAARDPRRHFSGRNNPPHPRRSAFCIGHAEIAWNAAIHEQRVLFAIPNDSTSIHPCRLPLSVLSRQARWILLERPVGVD